jgi:hypothetical protein
VSRIITHDAEGQIIEQGSAAWKQLRVGLFTGTSMGDLIPGKRGGYTDAREKAIYEVVAEIITGKPVTGMKANKYMREGVEKEPYARMAYEVKRDVVVDEVAFVQHDWLRCGASPDGLVRGRRRGCEFKSPKETTHACYLLNPQALVDEYFGQVQTNIWLLGYEDWDICSYHPDFEGDMQLLVVNVPRDERYINALEAECMKAHSEVNLLVKQLREKYPAQHEESVQ